MVDCNKELINRVGQHMTNDEFWDKFGREIEKRADAALEDNEDSDDDREREEDNQREIIIEEQNIKFTD